VRRLLIALVILALLLVGADFGLRAYAQLRVGQSLAASLDLAERPSVSLVGFPFLVRFVQGHLSSATVEGTDLEIDGLTFREVRFDLTEVRFPPGRILAGDDATIRARSGNGTLTLSGEGLTALLRDQGAPVTVRIRGGEVTVESDDLPGSVRASLSVDAGSLRLTGQGAIPVSFAVDLPAALPGLQLTDVRIEGSAAIASFSLDMPAFRVDQGS
jgi:hypothetical protein